MKDVIILNLVIPKLYNTQSLGPFEVYLQQNTEEDNGERKTIQPMLVGKLFKNSGISGIKTISEKGKSRLAVNFNCSKNANNFINNSATQYLFQPIMCLAKI